MEELMSLSKKVAKMAKAGILVILEVNPLHMDLFESSISNHHIPISHGNLFF
jgi:hypothetical protein